MKAWAPHGLAAAAGLGGAALAAFLGLPAAPLIGATVAVALVSALGGAVAVSNRLRDIAFALIGLSLGSGVNAEIVAHLPLWSASLVGLMLSLVATVFAGRWLLTRFFGLDPATAVLACSPGTMSNALAIAVEGRGDPTAVMVLQVLRLLVLVVAVPPLAVALGAPDADARLSAAPMPLLPLLLLLALTLLVGFAGARRKIPAATLLAGMVVSAVAHGSGLVAGSVPPWAIFLGFTVTGAVLGTRVSSVGMSELARFIAAGLAVIAATLVLATLFAVATWAVTGLPLGQIVIAYAPGGVEAMAAIGLLLGYDPAYVAAHHFTRILVLVVLIPLALPRDRGV